MPHIKLDDREFPLRVGEVRVGGADADIPVPLAVDAVTLAVIELSDDEDATIRRASSTILVRVNGVALGEERVPLMHGDRIELAGRELRFAADATATATMLVPAVPSQDDEWSAEPPVAAPSFRGGRLVSLVDGREYTVSASGLRIGRDASTDVVVPTADVSRKHCEITLGPAGYLLTDLSRNGVLVNGERIAKSRILQRGDVLRVGTEEFRFHAESSPSSAPRAVGAAVGFASGAAPLLPLDAASDPIPAAAVPISAPGGDPVRRSSRPAVAPLAILEVVNGGVLKGTRFEIRSPLTHVGRGAYNDVVVADESVSDAHAKLQRRETGWVIVDLGSTNGTYVGGRRIDSGGEAPIDGDVDVRFGGIKMTFRASAAAGSDAGGTRVIVGLKGPEPRRADPRSRQRPRATASVSGAPTEASRAPAARIWLWVGFVFTAGALLLLALQGR